MKNRTSKYQYAVRRAVEDRDARVNQPVILGSPAFLGDASGNITTFFGAALQDGQVVVRDMSGNLSVAYNQRVPLRAGLPIMVGYDPLAPKIFQVLGQRDWWSVQTVQSLILHHERHEFPNEDTVWVKGEQFLPWMAVPSGMSLVIYPSATATRSGWALGSSVAIDLTGYTPEYGAAIALVSVDSDGEYVITLGSTVSPLLISINDAPVAPYGTQPIWGVRLVAGMTSIEGYDLDNNRWTNLYDLRWGQTVGRGAQGSALNPRVAGELLPLTGINTVLNSSLYDAFPGACSLPDGTIIVVFRSATAHGTSNGVIKQTESTDGGVTWSAPATIYSPASQDARDPNLMRTSTGRLVLTVKLYNWTTNEPYPAVALVYDDDGATWSAAALLHEGFSEYGGVSSPATELSDGTLIVPTFGRNGGDTYEYARMSESVDGGETWVDVGQIAKSASRSYQEPNLVVFPNGTMLCFLRSTTTDRFYVTRSYNGGLSWTTPVDMFAAKGKPSIFRASNGALILVYRQDDVNGHAVYRISYDNGATWDAETELDTTGEMMYASSVEYSTGLVGVIYGVEYSASDSDLFIKRFATTLQSGQLVSVIPTGHAPLEVTSITLVTNLNADMVDGEHAATLHDAHSIWGNNVDPDLTPNDDEILMWNSVTSQYESVPVPSGSPAAHIHGLARWDGPLGEDTFDLPDYAEYVDSVMVGGIELDPIGGYVLSDAYDQIVLGSVLGADAIVTCHYVLATI